MGDLFDDYDAGSIRRTYDEMFDRFGRVRDTYRKAWDEYDKLPKSPEAERVWREFGPAPKRAAEAAAK